MRLSVVLDVSLWVVIGEAVFVDEKGCIVIPASIRMRLGIKLGTEFVVEESSCGRILLRPKRKLSARDLLGVADRERVRLEDVENALAEEN
jgi:AbrB family looped-hinge helix DNA binding protein